MCCSAVNDGSCSPWVMCSCSVVRGNQIRDTHPDRTDQPDEDSAESATSNHGFRVEASQHLPGRQEH